MLRVPQAEAKGVAVVAESFLDECETSGGLVDSDAHLLGTSHPQSAAAAKKSAAQASPPLKKAAKDVSWFWAVCMP
eukprot:COSAG06_NODE_2162_length_7444_cov_81.420150_6_plen_76_part_00